MNEKNMEIKEKLVQLEIKANEKAISLCNEIEEVILKFDGKKPTKRIDTALKNIDKNLCFKTEYNSLSIELFIEDRCISTSKFCCEYIRDTTTNICYCIKKSSYEDEVLNDDETLNSEKMILGVENRKKYLLESNESMKKSLNEIDDKIEEYEELKLKIRKFNDSIDYSVKAYFGLDKIKNVY